MNYLLPESERPDRLGHGTSEFGSFVHDILEQYGKNNIEAKDTLKYYEDNYTKNVVSDFTLYMSDAFYKDFAEKYYEDGYKFFRTFNGLQDIKILEAEKKFELPYKNKFLINGKIDVIGVDKNNNLCIIDYKSKSTFKSKKEKEEYLKQLYLYAWAFLTEMEDEEKWLEFKEKHNLPNLEKDTIKLAFYMFRKDKWVWFDFDKDKMNDVLKWVENAVNEINDEIFFDPIPEIETGEFNFYCKNFCSFRECCKYK